MHVRMFLGNKHFQGLDAIINETMRTAPGMMHDMDTKRRSALYTNRHSQASMQAQSVTNDIGEVELQATYACSSVIKSLLTVQVWDMDLPLLNFKRKEVKGFKTLDGKKVCLCFGIHGVAWPVLHLLVCAVLCCVRVLRCIGLFGRTSTKTT